MLTLRKRKIFILVCLIALVSTVLGVVFSNAASGDAASIQGALTDGRAFEKTEKLELQNDLKYMPKTYEAVVYVPKTAKTMGVIFGNYIRESRSCFTFRISAAGKPELQIIDKDLNTVVSTFDYDIRGEAWVHVAITHEVLSDGALFSCYVNGNLIGTNRMGKSYELDMHTAQSAVTPYIGKDFRNEYFFKGRIKDLALYTEALSADEIAASFNNGVGTHKSDLLALYDLSGAGDSNYIADLTTNGYDFAPQYYEREEEKTDYEYSFAIVGDTQYLIYQDAYKGTSYTSYIYDWIVQNKTAKNIQFVMGLGDITDQNGVDKTASDGIDQTDKEWTLAVSEHQKLTDAEIPYTVIRGNHDTVPKLDEYFAGNSNFSAMDIEYFDGNSLGNYYVTFTVGENEHKYMILCLDYCLEAGSAEMVWANRAIEQNPDHKVIITTHYHVNYDGSRYGDIWDSLVTYNKNVIMVISGHVGKTANTAKSYSVGAAGHTVLELLVDPQYLDTNYVYKNVGMVGMLYFSEDGSKVDFEYISTQKTLTDGGADVFYGRKNQFSYTIPAEPGTIMTKYGPIPSEYADPTAYPFVVFDENGNCLGGAQKFYGTDSADSAVGIAKTHLANNTYSNGEPVGTPHTATILMRADHSLKNQWYNNFSQVKGTITVDFNGYTLSTQTGTNADVVMLRCKHKTTGYPTELVFKNGTIALFNNPVLRLYGNVADKKMKFSFENVDFAVSGASPYLIAKYDATAEYDIFPEVNLTDCSIDISGSTAESITLFDVGTDKVHTTVTVNGGQVITGGKAFTIFGKTGDVNQGKLVFGEYDSAYMYLTLPKGTVPPSGDFVNGRGEKLIFAKYGTEDSTDIYRLTYEYVNTKYGIIPAEYTFTDKYPFLLFDENRNCKGGSDNFYTVVNNAKTYLAYNAYNGESYTYEGGVARQAIILMRCDHSILSGSYYDNISQVRGTITIDLNGYTLTRTGSESLMRSSMKAWASTASGDGRSVFPTELVFTNGSIELQDGALAKYAASAEGKELTYRYINIDFMITGTGTTFAATHTVEENPTVFGLKPEMYFENCTIDITGAKREDILLFNLGDETTCLDVYLNGCEIKALGTAFTLFEKDNESSTGSFTISDSDGVYNTLILPLGTAAPEISDIEFVKEAESADTVTYAMKSTLAVIPPSVETEYGEIPAEYADAKLYPIVVFRSNREFVGAYSLWGAQDSTATGALPNAKVAGSVVLLRDNFTYAGDYFNNLSQLNTGIVIDLGSFTFTVVHQPMFNAHKKTDYDTSITVKNGNIALSGGARVIKLNGNAKGTGKFDFTFDNVNFKLLSAAGTADIICNTSFTGVPPTPVQFGISLNDCNIDLSQGTKKVTLFNMIDELAKVTAVMKGGKIIGSANSFTLANMDGGNAESSLTFEKNESGEFTTVILPSSVAFENITVNGDKYVFAKKSDNGTESTYVLTPTATQNLDFIPKTSITLGSELVYNVYVPVSVYLKSFTLDGIEYTDFAALSENIVTIDGEDYYLIKVGLPAAEAARNIVLEAVVTVDEKDYTGKFTMSVLKYSEKIIASGNDVEVTLVKDVLSYIRAAYAYFDKEDAEALAKIDTLLGENYDTSNAPVLNGSSIAPSEGLKSVTYILNARPTIRFHITGEADSYAFYVDGTELKTTVGSNKNGTYIDMDVYAYAMAETITYTIDGVESGSYHMNSYYTFVTTDAAYKDNAELINLVARFAKYCESAAAYRDSVLENSN